MKLLAEAHESASEFLLKELRFGASHSGRAAANAAVNAIVGAHLMPDGMPLHCKSSEANVF